VERVETEETEEARQRQIKTGKYIKKKERRNEK